MAKVWLFPDGAQAEVRVVAWKGPVPGLKQWALDGKDIHTEATKLMARFIQENNVSMLNNLFKRKPWNEYDDKDEERQIGKTAVHANNYGLGVEKFSLITKLPQNVAKVVQDIYFTLFPEVRTGYQATLEKEVLMTRTIEIPFGWRRVFFDHIGPDLFRAAYAYYAQSTIGAWMADLFDRLTNCYGNVLELKLPTPSAIKACGVPVKLQVHDALGIAVDDDEPSIRKMMELVTNMNKPFHINNEPILIPVDFKLGPTWGEMKKVKL